MGKYHIIHKEIVGFLIENPSDVVQFKNRVEATKEGFNTSKIGYSIRNPKLSHKNRLWLNKEDYCEKEVEYRLTIYKNKTRKLFTKLYKNCIKCKIEKSWLEYYTHYNKEKSSTCIECVKKSSEKWTKCNRDLVNERARKNKYTQKRSKIDMNFRLRKNLSQRLRGALKNNSKKSSILKYLGCSISDLIKHLESQFKDGMSWNNYGKWQIDHIIPLSLYDLTDENNVYKLCHYTNLQPLWTEENLKKGNKLISEEILSRS